MNRNDKRRYLTRLGKTQQKVLLLLLGGVTIGLSGSPKTAFKVIHAVHKEWQEINKKALDRSIAALHHSGHVVVHSQRGKTALLTLSKMGRARAAACALNRLTIHRPKKWDGHWRIVMFDIPEEFRKNRNSFAVGLKEMGFVQLQKSCFVFPFPCLDEIEVLADFHEVRPFITFLVAESLEGSKTLARRFKLT